LLLLAHDFGIALRPLHKGSSIASFLGLVGSFQFLASLFTVAFTLISTYTMTTELHAHAGHAEANGMRWKKILWLR
jgi:hypothetical protein